MRSKRLKLVASIVRRDEDKLAQDFQLAKQHLDDEKSRLLELKNYYTGYVDMFNQKTDNLRAQDIAQSRQLLARLAQALNLKETQIETAIQKVAQAQSQWQEGYLKRCSIDELVGRCELEEQSQESIKEQKLMDEWIATTRFTR